MKIGIGNRYALWFSAMGAAVLVVSLLGTGALIWRSTLDLKEKLNQGTSENFEDIQHATLFNLADFLRRELFTPLYELNIEDINRTIKDLYRGMPVKSVRIADLTGKVLTDGTHANPSYGMQLRVDRKRLESSPVLIEHEATGRRVTFLIGVPDYELGFGEIVYSQQPLTKALERQDLIMSQILMEYRNTLLRVAVVTAALIAIATILLSLLFSRTLSFPLVSLRDATVQLARGELDHRVAVKSQDELGELAAAFNKMAEDLQNRTREAAKANEALLGEVEKHKRTERALRESRERLILAQTAGRVGVYDWYPAERRGMWSGAEELFGLPDRTGYEEWRKNVHPEDLERLQTEFNRWVSERRTQVDYQYRFFRPDGAMRWMSATGKVFYSPEGGATRVVGTVLDVTEAKEYQASLESAKEAAEAANVAKSAFLANMSHEMRTPLGGVLGMINLVLEMAITEEERQLLEMAKRSAESLLRLISDLLDFSRIEVGQLSFERAEFSVGELVDSAVSVVAIQAKEKGLVLWTRIEETVPKRILGDQGRLRQVLVNLVGNSVKFTAKGEIEVTVAPYLDPEQPQGRFLLFSVRDTGIGITPEQQERIFEKFVQVDPTAKRKYGGAGLGLALSKEIIAAVGGKIWVESELGAGSTFRFTYPLG